MILTAHKTRVRTNQPGHEYETVININGFNINNYVPKSIEAAIAIHLPDGWKIENRGSRLEVHAPGPIRRTTDEVEGTVVLAACKAAGLDAVLGEFH